MRKRLVLSGVVLGVLVIFVGVILFAVLPSSRQSLDPQDQTLEEEPLPQEFFDDLPDSEEAPDRDSL